MVSKQQKDILGFLFDSLVKTIVILFSWLLVPYLLKKQREIKNNPPGLVVDRNDIDILLNLLNTKTPILVNGEHFEVGEVTHVNHPEVYDHLVQAFRQDGRMMLEIVLFCGAEEGEIGAPAFFTGLRKARGKQKPLDSVATLNKSWHIGKMPISDDLAAVLR